METAPLVAALTSTLAIGLAAVLAKLVRQERQRSDARVSMLTSLAAEPVPSMPATPVTPTAPAAPMARPPVRLEPRQRTPQAARRAAVPVAADIEIFRDAPVDAAPAMPDLFEPAPARSGRALVYVFAAAVVMVALIAFSFRWAVSAPGAASETTQAVAAAVAQPLSLVSLGHEQHADGTLVISGIVRNPPDSTARERLFAVASLLDAAGVLIASARAPLDFTTLAPGDESPFVVRVAGASGVARYRIGFRDAEGRSVGHVDRR